jgi:hypothetical protein
MQQPKSLERRNTYILETPIQRWLCRACGLRFSDPKTLALQRIATVQTKELRSQHNKDSSRQICVSETKNLSAEQQTIEVLQGNKDGEFAQKIYDYSLWLNKNGKSEATIRGRVKLLTTTG